MALHPVFSEHTINQLTLLFGNLLFPLYERKAERRAFSPEQRRIIWNSDEERTCPGCRKALTWDDFTLDHILAYAKGGKTTVKNARAMCQQCNSRKGAG